MEQNINIFSEIFKHIEEEVKSVQLDDSEKEEGKKDL